MLLPQHMRYTLHVTKSWDELVSLLRKLDGSEQPSTSHKSLIKTEPEQSYVNWLSNSRSKQRPVTPIKQRPVRK